MSREVPYSASVNCTSSFSRLTEVGDALERLDAIPVIRLPVSCLRTRSVSARRFALAVQPPPADRRGCPAATIKRMHAVPALDRRTAPPGSLRRRLLRGGRSRRPSGWARLSHLCMIGKIHR